MKRRFRWSDERTKALLDLRENGTASSRKLAERWNWDRDKVRRFLRFIDQHEAEIIAAYPPQGAVKGGAVKKALSTPCGAVKDAPLERYLLDKKPLEAGGSYTGDLIDEMNRCLSARFSHRDDYKPVLHDNHGSEEAGRDLQAAGVDLAWAIQRLRQHAMQFHPERHGKGRLPGTLKFFRNWLLRDWKSERQTEIPLLTVESPLSGIHDFKSVEDQKPQKPEQIRGAVFSVLGSLAG